jgi:hypothetical protein
MKGKTRLIALALVLALALSLLPGGSVSAQKHPPPVVELVPNPTLFNGLDDTQVVDVRYTGVFNFFAADFRLSFPATLLQVVQVESGPAFDGMAPIVRVDGAGPTGTVEFANTRLGGPILWSDSLTIARITFRAVVPGPTANVFGFAAPLPQVIAPDGTITVAALAGPYNFSIQPALGAGVRGQALWGTLPQPPAGVHAGIPVEMTTAGGAMVLTTVTGNRGYYPPLGIGSIPSMPAGGQIHINPLADGRIPALETALKNCPNTPNLTPHTVVLVMGDVAPLLPERSGNNAINIQDLVVSASRFGQPALDTNGDGWWDGDVDNNAIINILDIVAIANNFGKTGPIVESCP